MKKDIAFRWKGKEIESYKPGAPIEHLNYDLYWVDPVPPHTVKCYRRVSIENIKKSLRMFNKFTIVQDTTYKSDLWLLPNVGENINPYPFIIKGK